ncbi:hypothetical protein PFISCL1PPCAC_1525, partial [Pristionchus fissidentatus]
SPSSAPADWLSCRAADKVVFGVLASRDAARTANPPSSPARPESELPRVFDVSSLTSFDRTVR